jgi:hypothetical protein
MLSKMIHSIQPRHIGLLALCGLAFLYMALFRYDNYGIDEGAAQALLINWSIMDHIANATPLFAIPDLRAIMFTFLDIHWAGSLAAAKVFTLFVWFGTALMLYRWAEANDSSETATMATALLLISPVAVMQVDSISPGIFLLFCFVSAFWFDQFYQESQRTLTGSFFMILLMCAFAVSMHPIGLALPLALCITWFPKKEEAPEKRRNLLIGLVISTSLLLLIRMGWQGLEDGGNHLAILGAVLTGSPIIAATPPIGYGLIVASLLGFVVILYLYRRYFEPMGLMLIMASLIGLLQADYSWALITLATILYLGLPMLIAAHRKTGIQNLMGQRGLVIILIVVCTSIFTSADKKQRMISQLKLKSDVDYLLTSAAAIAAKHQDEFLIASQWPARTMMATRRDVLPLPPKSILEHADTFTEKTQGITHFMFDPRDPKNQQLSKISASLGHAMEAIEILPAGAILKVNKH